MKNYLVYFIYKNIALFAFILYMISMGEKITDVVIFSLILACIHLVTFYVNIKVRQNKIYLLLLAIELIIIYFINCSIGSILGIIVILELIDYFKLKQKIFNIIAFTILCITLYIFYIDISILIVQIILCNSLLFTCYLSERLLYYKNETMLQKTNVAILNDRIKEIKHYHKTIKQVAILEERNRFSSRIHDNLGHSISGSIILLEGSLLIIEKDSEKAKLNINRAVDNLRNGVDDIRKSLREERPKLPILNLNQVKEILEEFSLQHDIKTDLIVSNEVDIINYDIWHCIHENLMESLTNVLKHSNAGYFTLRIMVTNKIIRVEYINDKVKNTSKQKGIGLMLIEERVVFLGGTSIVINEDDVFKVINTFIVN